VLQALVYKELARAATIMLMLAQAHSVTKQLVQEILTVLQTHVKMELVNNAMVIVMEMLVILMEVAYQVLATKVSVLTALKIKVHCVIIWPVLLTTNVFQALALKIYVCNVTIMLNPDPTCSVLELLVLMIVIVHLTLV
jgi:hypothetical protein